MTAPPGRILMLLYRPFEFDSRVEREARALVARGFEVEVIAREEGSLPATEDRDGYSIRRVSPEGRGTALAQRLAGSSAPSFLRALAHRAYWFLHWRGYLRAARLAVRDSEFGLCVAHDLDTLAAGARVARAAAVPLVYDCHELYADMATVKPRPEFERRAWIAYERYLIRRADAVFAVTASRAAEMARRHDIETPLVLRNVPEVTPRPVPFDIRERLGLGEADPVALYLGQSQPNRGLDVLTRAVAGVERCHLVRMGEGPSDYARFLDQLAGELGIADRVHALPPVRPHDVVGVAAAADVGVVVNPNVSLNNYLSLPNKIFEYFGAGVPVVASDFPDMADLIGRYKAGETCDPEDPADVARALRAVLDPERIGEYRAGAASAGRELTWENESRIFLDRVELLFESG